MKGKSGKLFVLSAPSGAGKTTLKDMLLAEFPEIKYSISATTRPMRPGEKDGEHYFFKSDKQFKEMIEKGAFVEFNEVHGNFYGTPKAPIQKNLEEDASVILDLDVYGKVNFDREFPQAVGILILPPSKDVLKKRLTERKSESPEALKLRLENAIRELDFAKSRGKYEYQIINDHLDQAYQELKKIYLKEVNA